MVGDLRSQAQQDEDLYSLLRAGDAHRAVGLDQGRRLRWLVDP